MGRHMMRAAIALALGAAALAVPAQAQVLGEDAAACTSRSGPAIQATIVGLKDREGALKLELYPANEDDFLEHDNKLRAENKVFRRVSATPPATGNPMLCIKVPRPGRWALFFGHDRDGKRKFSFWTDGAGFPSNRKLGRARPKLTDAIIDVGPGVTTTTIRAQYLRGIGGFSYAN